MGVKHLLFLVVILAVGVLVLPSTVSLFAGQHYWYNISGEGSQIPCRKCHADIYEELKNNPYHENFDCELCHRAVNITYASDYGGDVYGGNQAHAASTLSCMICHSRTTGEGVNHSHYEYPNSVNCNLCHSPDIYPPVAGGFGITGQSGDTGSNAAHRQFVLDAKNDSLMESANEACIACHTHVAVKINFTHYKVLEFNVSWNQSKYITEGYAPNTSTGIVSVIWGNTSGAGFTNYPGGTQWP